jgi:prepilin-type N-terminal cleavage/methylation domain-containing protein
MPDLTPERGRSLIELVLVVIIVGIISTIAVRSLKKSADTARTEETKRELRRLCYAVAGDPDLISNGSRIDYGYVGDVGALPPDLSALVQNPGGYATWDGPYVYDEFSVDGAEHEFLWDAWGRSYIYTGGNVVASVGGGGTISQMIGNSVSDLLHNQVSLVICNLNTEPPGPTYKDSIRVMLSYPDGTGGLATDVLSPREDGSLTFDSIPIGLHDLSIVFAPDNDTVSRRVGVLPGGKCYAEIQLNRESWQ